MGDYLILKDPYASKSYSVRVYKINNTNTISVESLENEDITSLEGFIFKNISVLVSPNIFQLNNKLIIIAS